MFFAKIFTINKDYVLLDKVIKQNGSGGHNREQIILDIDNFKNI